MVYRSAGQCPACARKTDFVSNSHWLRDNLLCEQCHSLPRERAFAHCLETFVPGWRSMVVHECSPADRGISARMRRECPGYIGSHYYPDVPRGTIHEGYRSEDLDPHFPSKALISLS